MDPQKIYEEYGQKYAEFEPMLEEVVQNHELHAQWLNVLSYLEFIGSRKIFKTQEKDILNESILHHASDEARHALILKQMIEKLPVQNFNSYDSNHLLQGYSGFRYFQSLDSMVKAEIYPDKRGRAGTAFLCYVYVSLIIEIRANWMYEIYARVLKKYDSPVTVASIVNDEIRHLKDTMNEIEKLDQKGLERVSDFIEREKIYFQKFYESLLNRLNART